jgi:peptide/nickel transport system ATP-binding protein
MGMNPLLSVENLSVEFSTDEGVVSAVRNMNLSVGPDQCMGLVGESGSGKSVTALAIMRLLGRVSARVTSGHVWFSHPTKGRIDLLALSEEEMQKIRGNHISMIFQEPMTSLNPVKRCGPQVLESMVWHGISGEREGRKRVLSLFEEVRLPDPSRVFRAWPHELSGGQRQRVMIAMAMACNPSLLIADEPTTALDVTVQKTILELMASLQQTYGMGILFISHDLGVIGEIASAVSVMLNGEVVESGPIGQIFNQASHPYTKALIACRPGLSGRPERLAVVSDFTGPGNMLKMQDPEERDKAHARMYSVPPVLEVRSLKTDFVTARSFLGKPVSVHRAVDDISFEVYRGETLGLVGESGCGKTTLGRTIMRLVEPSGGKVVYKGVDLSRLSGRELRKLRPRFQIIFQDPYSSLTPGIPIGRAIMEPMRVHGILGNDRERQERVMELLGLVNLEVGHFYRYPHEFSGGQRQRICIARALALNPEFIVCDEAVSALDVSVQAQVLNLLNELKLEFGLTYLFISHDLSVVKFMSDRVIVMKDGKMEELAEADQLYASPQSGYTRKLFDSIPGKTFYGTELR